MFQLTHAFSEKKKLINVNMSTRSLLTQDSSIQNKHSYSFHLKKHESSEKFNKKVFLIAMVVKVQQRKE